MSPHFWSPLAAHLLLLIEPYPAPRERTAPDMTDQLTDVGRNRVIVVSRCPGRQIGCRAIQRHQAVDEDCRWILLHRRAKLLVDLCPLRLVGFNCAGVD